jgi:quinolinate synthase
MSRLLDCWTATNGNPRPMFICINQVEGGMVEMILRDEQKTYSVPNAEICIRMNNWTLGKLGDVLRNAANKFECGLEFKTEEKAGVV